MIRSLSVAALIVGSLALQSGKALAQTPPTHQHSFSHAEMWSEYFDDPKRDETQKPHEVIQALALKPDALVADIGSGTGYFSVRLAHAVPRGRVYGVDIEPDMVKFLAERANKEKLGNVVSLQGAPDDPRLPVKVDLVLMVEVFHHISNRVQYLTKLRSYLKPGGRIAIIDFNEKSPMGPPPAERIPPGSVKAELTRAGYTLADEYSFLPDQYFLVFKVGK